MVVADGAAVKSMHRLLRTQETDQWIVEYSEVTLIHKFGHGGWGTGSAVIWKQSKSGASETVAWRSVGIIYSFALL